MTENPPYELMGAVAPEEMPEPQKGRRQGVWTTLADKMITDHQAGFVTVVKVDSDADYDRLRNGLRQPIRDRDPSLRIVFATVPKDGKLQVYLRLVGH